MFGTGVVCSKRAAALLAGLAILPCLLWAQVLEYERPQPGNGHLIPSVPFERSVRDNYCGPAALAMVLNFWDQKRSFRQREIADQVFDYRNQVTYGSELVLYPRTKGFMTYSVQGNLRLLRRTVAEGIPVIVLTRTSRQIDCGHYRVVIGYDDNLDVIIFHDPYFGERSAMRVRDFREVWELGKGYQTRWMMAVLPAGLPFPELADDPITAINLATALYRRADYAAAREQWENARQKLGDDAFLLYGLALVNLSQGRLDEAEACARKALVSDDTNAFAHDALGLAYARQGRISEAFDALGHAYRLAPKDPSIRSHYLKCRDLVLAAARRGVEAKAEVQNGGRDHEKR